MNLELTNKVIIVTGGDNGISRDIIKVLAKEGAIPVIVGRSEEENRKVVQAVEDGGGKVSHIISDLIGPSACEKTVNTVLKQYGRIDGLVNNAVLNNTVGLETGSHKYFMDTLHKNVVSYYLMAHFALPALKQSKGAILNITFSATQTGQENIVNVETVNGGRNALTREWAVELIKYGIRVNALVITERQTYLNEYSIKAFNQDQNLTETESIMPLSNRMTTAQDIANVSAFLLSSRSSHTTGQLINING